LLVLVVLSGCAGLWDAGSPTPSTADASTPTPSAPQTATPSPTATTPSPDRLPSGLTDTGVRNVTQLIRTHQTTAIETPGVVTHTTNSTGRGVGIVATVRAAADTNLTRVQYVGQSQRMTKDETQNSTTVVAANETSVRQYTVADGTVTLDNRRNRTDLFDRSLRGLSTATSPLRGALRRGNFSVTGSDESDNATVVTLRGDRYAGSQLYAAENVVAYNATVRITTDGLIRSATERIVAQRNGSESHYYFTYDFEPQSVDLPPVPQIPREIDLR
jgi:hypothetical protein